MLAPRRRGDVDRDPSQVFVPRRVVVQAALGSVRPSGRVMRSGLGLVLA